MSNGGPGAIRTPDPFVRSEVLYPTELRALVGDNLYYYKSTPLSGVEGRNNLLRTKAAYCPPIGTQARCRFVFAAFVNPQRPQRQKSDPQKDPPVPKSIFLISTHK